MAKDPLADFDIKTKKTKSLEWFDSLAAVRIIVRPTVKGILYIYPVFKEGKAEKEEVQHYELSRRYASIFSDS